MHPSASQWNQKLHFHLLVSRLQDIVTSQLWTSVSLTHTLMSRAPGVCLIIPSTCSGDGCSHNISCIRCTIKETGEIKRLFYALWTWNILVYFNEMTCLFWMLLLILGAFWRNVCVALSWLEALWNNGQISHGVRCIIYQLKQHCKYCASEFVFIVPTARDKHQLVLILTQVD